ncbi:hypothetical protein DIPPA_34666 [Diplonema papillatum]|nr:hypothetical protein DIPPA_34666 [Diplonema papillatum]
MTSLAAPRDHEHPKNEDAADGGAHEPLLGPSGAKLKGKKRQPKARSAELTSGTPLLASADARRPKRSKRPITGDRDVEPRCSVPFAARSELSPPSLSQMQPEWTLAPFAAEGGLSSPSLSQMQPERTLTPFAAPSFPRGGTEARAIHAHGACLEPEQPSQGGLPSPCLAQLENHAKSALSETQNKKRGPPRLSAAAQPGRPNQGSLPAPCLAQLQNQATSTLSEAAHSELENPNQGGLPVSQLENRAKPPSSENEEETHAISLRREEGERKRKKEVAQATATTGAAATFPASSPRSSSSDPEPTAAFAARGDLAAPLLPQPSPENEEEKPAVSLRREEGERQRKKEVAQATRTTSDPEPTAAFAARGDLAAPLLPPPQPSSENEEEKPAVSLRREEGERQRKKEVAQAAATFPASSPRSSSSDPEPTAAFAARGDLAAPLLPPPPQSHSATPLLSAEAGGGGRPSRRLPLRRSCRQRNKEEKAETERPEPEAPQHSREEDSMPTSNGRERQVSPEHDTTIPPPGERRARGAKKLQAAAPGGAGVAQKKQRSCSPASEKGTPPGEGSHADVAEAGVRASPSGEVVAGKGRRVRGKLPGGGTPADAVATGEERLAAASPERSLQGSQDELLVGKDNTEEADARAIPQSEVAAGKERRGRGKGKLPGGGTPADAVATGEERLAAASPERSLQGSQNDLLVRKDNTEEADARAIPQSEVVAGKERRGRGKGTLPGEETRTDAVATGEERLAAASPQGEIVAGNERTANRSLQGSQAAPPVGKRASAAHAKPVEQSDPATRVARGKADAGQPNGKPSCQEVSGIGGEAPVVAGERPAAVPAEPAALGAGAARLRLVARDTDEFWAFEDAFNAHVQGHNEHYVHDRLAKGLEPLRFVLRSVQVPRDDCAASGALRARFHSFRSSLARTHGHLPPQAHRVRKVFHGTHARNLPSILGSGLLPYSHSLSTASAPVDEGYFGSTSKGVYVARYVDYALQYSNNVLPLQPGDVVDVLQFEAVLGSCLHIKEAVGPVDPTPGYHSHCSPKELEWYLFSEAQLWPAAVLSVEAIKDERTMANDF